MIILYKDDFKNLEVWYSILDDFNIDRNAEEIQINVFKVRELNN